MDNDIDIGCWEDEKDKLFAICPELLKENCSFYIGNNFTILFNNIKISIALYQRSEKVASRKTILEKKNFLSKFLYRWYLIFKNALYLQSLNLHSKTFKLGKITNYIVFWLGGFPKNILYDLTDLTLKICEKFNYTVKWEIPHHYFASFKKINFYGMEFNVPSPVEKYLEYRYGKDWMIPKRDWVYHRDDGATSSSP